MTTAIKTRKTAGTKWSVGDLLSALQVAADAVPTRTPRPVLLNVLLRDGRMVAGNGDVQIDLPCDGEVTTLLPQIGRAHV